MAHVKFTSPLLESTVFNVAGFLEILLKKIPVSEISLREEATEAYNSDYALHIPFMRRIASKAYTCLTSLLGLTMRTYF